MLKVDEIDLHYGAAQVLRRVSLDAEPGRITCLLGRNGVGKTSLLRAVIGEHPVTRGDILWQGEPLRSYELILGFIGSTKTTTGLRVKGLLNDKDYPRGIAITKSQMRAIPIETGSELGQWNYTIG